LIKTEPPQELLNVGIGITKETSVGELGTEKIRFFAKSTFQPIF
jgi:hypothetical protein